VPPKERKERKNSLISCLSGQMASGRATERILFCLWPLSFFLLKAPVRATKGKEREKNSLISYLSGQMASGRGTERILFYLWPLSFFLLIPQGLSSCPHPVKLVACVSAAQVILLSLVPKKKPV
jgi:hypothetical protein